jgi:hypothetical protein
VAAQNQILAGLPQIQNALLGNQVDLSGLQAYQAPQQDYGFFNQTLPQITQAEAAAQAQADATAAGMGTGSSQGQSGMNFNNGNLARYLAGGGNSHLFNKGIQWL